METGESPDRDSSGSVYQIPALLHDRGALCFPHCQYHAYLWRSTECVCSAHALDAFFTESKVCQSYVTLKTTTKVIPYQSRTRNYVRNLKKLIISKIFYSCQHKMYLGIKKDIFWFEISTRKQNEKFNNENTYIPYIIKHFKLLILINNLSFNLETKSIS